MRAIVLYIGPDIYRMMTQYAVQATLAEQYNEKWDLRTTGQTSMRVIAALLAWIGELCARGFVGE